MYIHEGEGVLIKLTQSGNFNKLNNFFEKILEKVDLGLLDRYGRQGVEALSNATPVDTGLTADSWGYTISNKGNKVQLNFTNSNIIDGVPIAIVIQYGHLTRSGCWVEGVDYINPAIQPIFNDLVNTMWKELTNK